MEDMNKFDRVVSILMLLQTKRIVRAHELAERFEVSLRTIYRDLRTLENAGVPIHAEAGVGYSLVEGYNLPPVMFTENEATSFLIAEKLVEKMTDENTAKRFSDAVLKIKSVLKSTDKDKINNLEKHIHVSRRFSDLPELSDRIMPTIFDSIDRKMVLEIDYEAHYSNEKTTRSIEPLGLHFYADYWHLIAYCQLRKDYRDFRVDRIGGLRETTGYFSGDHPNLKEYLSELSSRQDLMNVTVSFKSAAADFARRDKFFYGFVGERIVGEAVEMDFLVPYLHGIAHWLLVYVDSVRVCSPPELNEMMQELTKRLVQNYS